MKRSYDFWIACFATWSVKKTVPIEDFSIVYHTETGTVKDSIPDRWTEPGTSFRTLRTTTIVPFDNASLRFDLTGETLVRIDGRPFYGVNPYHRACHIPAASGTSLELTLEQVTTGLMGTQEANPGVRQVAWVEIDSHAESCYWDLKVLVEWGQSSETPRHLAEWLWRTLDQILQPLYAAAPDAPAIRAYTERLGRDAEEEGLYLSLQQELDLGLRPAPPLLLAANIQRIRSQFDDLFRELAKLRLRGIGTIRLFGHAHIDLAWLWPIAETRQKVIRTAASQSYLLSQFPDWHFGMSSPAMWDMLQHDDALWPRWQHLTEEQRVIPLGAFWVETDAQLIDGGAILRHLFYGLRYFEEMVGQRPRTAFLPDTFGFSGGLPTLLAQAGIRLFLTTKINWNDTTVFPYKDFVWVGPDGSEVQAQIFGTSPDGYNGKAHLADLHSAWQGYVAGGGGHEVLYAFGHGDGGGGPDQDMLERIRRYQGLPLVPDLAFGSPEDLILSNAELATLPQYSGDLYLEYHRGVFTAQTRVKSLSRFLYALLTATEAWTTMANLTLDRDSLWRLLLPHHFHDILPGSSIHAVYQDFDQDMVRLSTKIQEAHGQALATLFPMGPEPGLILSNPSGFPAPAQLLELDMSDRQGRDVYWNGRWHQAIKVANSNRWTVQVPALPPLGMLVLPTRRSDSVGQDSEAPSILPTGFTWEGTRIAVTITRQGIQSFVLEGREMLQHTAAIRAFFQHPPHFDAWELVDDSQRGYIDLVHDPIVIDEDSPHRVVLRLVHHTALSTIVERIDVDKLHERISLMLTMELLERHLVIQYLVPTTLVTDRVTRESLWGPQYAPTWPRGPQDRAAFEWVAHRFVDLGEPHWGFALLNDGRYGHAVHHGSLSITLATTPLYPDPQADQTPYPVRLRFLPHRGHWTDAGIMAEAHGFSHPLLTTWADTECSTPRLCSPMPSLPPNVALLAYKPAEDGSGDRICYLGEMWGDDTRFDLEWSDTVCSVTAIDFVSEHAHHDATISHVGNCSTVHIPPRGFLALRIQKPHQKPNTEVSR